MRWLTEALARGPARSIAVKAAAAEAGISQKSLRQARQQLRVIHARSGNRRSMASTWSLPFAYHHGGAVIVRSARGPESRQLPRQGCMVSVSPAVLRWLAGDELVRVALAVGVSRNDIAGADNDAQLRAFISLALEPSLATEAGGSFVPTTELAKVSAGGGRDRHGICLSCCNAASV
jgi:hypothetical protein